MPARRFRLNEGLPDPEELLLDYAQRLRNHLPGRRAVHCHLSKLLRHNRQSEHLRLAAQTFSDLTKRHEGQCFRLRNGDLVVVAKDASTAEIDKPVMKLQYLFSEDPLLQQDTDAQTHRFCTWYDLEQDYPGFFNMAKDLAEAARKAAAANTDIKIDKSRLADIAVHTPGALLDPQRLGQLEAALAGADITPLLRYQPVCAIATNRQPQPVFQETYVSIPALRERMMPDVDLLSDRWLFQHLTEMLDQRLLAALPDISLPEKLAISINLNVGSILSKAFTVFERTIRQQPARSIILELRAADIFCDTGRFIFARDLARQQGFKLCIDGHTHISFPMLRRDDLGVDLEKVHWNPDLVDAARSSYRQRFDEAVAIAGPDRIILCRCDDERAIEFGRSLGISLFQGQYIDNLLR